jgi:uncharacterized membrane protein YqjE
MEASTVSLTSVAAKARHFTRQMLIIGENRLELLAVEVQEERDRLVCTVLLALGLAAFGLLAGLALTAAIVVWLWHWSPVAALLILAGIYGGVGGLFYWRLTGLLRDWQTLSATLEQFRKDRIALEKILT